MLQFITLSLAFLVVACFVSLSYSMLRWATVCLVNISWVKHFEQNKKKKGIITYE